MRGALFLLMLAHMASPLFLVVADIDPSPVQDALEYKTLGLNILHGNGFSTAPDAPFTLQLLRTPLYPLFLAATYFIDTSGYVAVFIQQLLLIVSAWLLVVVVARLTGRRMLGLVAGAALLLEPQLWLLSLQTMSETLFVFLFSLSLYALSREGFRSILWVGVLSGLAALVKPFGILFIPIFAFGRVFATRSIMQGVIIFLVAGLVIAPWIIRNHALTGDFILSSSSAFNMAQGLGSTEERALLPETVRTVSDVRGREGSVIASFGVDTYPVVKSVASTVDARLGIEGFAYRNLVCAPRVWFPHHYDVLLAMIGVSVGPQLSNVVLGVDLVLWIIVGILAILGLVRIILQRHWSLVLVCGGSLGAVTLLNLCISYTRMLAGVLPAVFLLAAAGIAWGMPQSRKKEGPLKMQYLAFARLPTEKAHGLQIMKTCEAFAEKGVEVELVVPTRTSAISEDPFAYYNINTHFILSRVRSPDWVHFGFLGFALSLVLFSEYAAWRSNFWKAGVVYSRDALVLFQYALLGRPLVFEAHQKPSWLRLMVARRAMKVVVISHALKEAYRQGGVLENNILVAPDAVDIARFTLEESKENVRARYGFPKGLSIVLYAGHLYPRKGAHILAEASEFIPNALTVFVGGTESDVQVFTDTWGGCAQVRILGHKPPREIPYLLHAADVLVIPNSAANDDASRYGSPMKLFEYLASGTPVVASRVSAIEEVVGDEAVYFVEPDSAKALAEGIRHVIKDGSGHSRAVRAREIVRQHSWSARTETILAGLQSRVIP